MKLVCTLLLVLASVANAAEKPNFIFILSDDIAQGEIEIYDLSKDVAETNNLATERPDLVEKAKQIFADAHTPHPVWPLDRSSDLKNEAGSKAWPVKRKRDKEGYVPEGAIPLAEYLKN
jgi:hypothetical protein